jgi:hypothetical protein
LYILVPKTNKRNRQNLISMKRVIPNLRVVVLCLLLAISSTRGSAQSITSGNGQWEAGLGFGPMFFLGDLGGTAGYGKPFIKDLDFPLTNLGKTLYVNYYPAEWIGFRLSLNHGVVKGNDAEAPNKGGAEVDRLLRNLSFKSSILEAYFAMEIYPTVFFEQYDGLAHKLRPYGLIGIGGYKFNPKAQLDGKWVALQPLRLEGQGMVEYPDSKPYKLTQMEIPMGFGAKYYLNEKMYVGLEIVHRKLFTDLLDDVSTGYVDPVVFDSYLSAADAAKAKRLYYRGLYTSPLTRPGDIQTFQRGDPTENDAFFSSTIRFGWRLNSYEDSRSRKQLRCPVFY